MSIIPDLSWASALKMPTKIIVGLFLFFTLTLLLGTLEVIDLSDKNTKSAVIVLAVLFGCLTTASIGAIFFDHLKMTRKIGLVAKRRSMRQESDLAKRAEYEANALSRLDFLSKEELYYVADCLKKNEQSFLAYAHSGPIATLIAKGLVATPGGIYNRNYYPYMFLDFAWRELLRRKEEFITKEASLKAIEKKSSR